MVEFLIPFLLMARFPTNDVDVYHGPEYIFNVSRTYMEESYNNSIIHGQMIATMKCQNSSVTNIICKLSDLIVREYIETLATKNINTTIQNNNLQWQPLLFNCKNTQLCDTFEIKFDKSGMQGLIINENFSMEKSHYKIILMALVRQLNIFYINQYNTTDGLIKMKENYNHDNVDVTIKISKEKLPFPYSEIVHFEIESIKGFDGFKYTYKITRDFKKFKNIQQVIALDNLSTIQIQPISSIHRLIISPYHFISMNDEEVLTILPDGKKLSLINKFNVILDSIQPAKNSLPPVLHPLYENIY